MADPADKDFSIHVHLVPSTVMQIEPRVRRSPKPWFAQDAMGDSAHLLVQSRLQLLHIRTTLEISSAMRTLKPQHVSDNKMFPAARMLGHGLPTGLAIGPVASLGSAMALALLFAQANQPEGGVETVPDTGVDMIDIHASVVNSPINAVHVIQPSGLCC